MKRYLKFFAQLAGLVGTSVFGAGVHASVPADSPVSLDQTHDQEIETLDVDVQSQAEIDRLYDLIRTMKLKADTESFDGSKIRLKMPKNDKVQLAGQIWIEK